VDNPRSGPGTAVRALACALALGWAPGAWGQTQEGPDKVPAPETEGVPPAPEAAPVGPDALAPPPWKTRLGMMLDVGAPDGLGVSALVRPLRWLRLNAGATTNSMGYGVRGGASLMPLELFLNPTLNVDLGHYFNADYGKLLERLHGGPSSAGTLIRNVGYDYASASLGLEFSPSSHVTLFGQVGLSYWSIRVEDVESFIRDASDDPDITARPLSIRLSSPAAKLGLIVYFN
jgi:hypothetical protein